MLDIKFIRENLKEVKAALAKKHTKFDLDELLKVDDRRKKILAEIEELRAKRNCFAHAQDIQNGKKIKTKIEKLEPELKKVEEKFNEIMSGMHNIPDKSVPSKTEGNKVIRTWGKPKKFSTKGGSAYGGDFKPKDHVELGEKLDIIDIKRATKVSGSRMAYLKNEGALLEFALVNYLFEKLQKKGFIPMVVPALVRERAMFGSGFFPTEKMEYYKTAEDDLFLSGTSEVSLCSYHADEILDEAELPKKYVGFSSCFRREAGTYGKDTQGIFRVHQFDKIEMFAFTDPIKSWQEFEKLQKIVEEIFKDLGLPYQVLNMSGGDIGAPNAKKYDTEVWLPGQNQYRELTSCSHDTDFQARRLNIKFRKKDGRTDYVYTMNCTAAAIGRTLIAILENYQQKDGSIKIPKVLQKYTGFKEIRKEKNG